MKKIIQKLFRSVGFEVRRREKNKERTSMEVAFHSDLDKNLNHDYNSEAFEQIKIVRKNTMMPYVNLVSLYEQVVYVEQRQIEGDFVECGVWKGGSVGLMALANLKHAGKRRTLHLFDIFDDICEPDPAIDGELAVKEAKEFTGNKSMNVSGKLKPMVGFYDQFGGKGTLEENRSLLEEVIKYDKKKIFYHKGWFQDIVPVAKNEINKIAILRLDGDYYASTKVCLDNLYEKVVPSGLIIIDDYGTYEGCKKAVDEFREKNNIKSFLHYSNSDCRYWFKNNC
jgi:O-methyltransferase